MPRFHVVIHYNGRYVRFDEVARDIDTVRYKYEFVKVVSITEVLQ